MGPPPLVLVIDDNANIREALAIALGLEGYAVETATDGLDALQKLHAGLRPDLVVSDMMMPVMNGFAFRQAMLSDPTLPSIPFIAYSAVTDPNETAQHLHADACLYKPANVAQIAAIVHRFCRPSANPVH